MIPSTSTSTATRAMARPTHGPHEVVRTLTTVPAALNSIRLPVTCPRARCARALGVSTGRGRLATGICQQCNGRGVILAASVTTGLPRKDVPYPDSNEFGPVDRFQRVLTETGQAGDSWNPASS